MRTEDLKDKGDVLIKRCVLAQSSVLIAQS